MRATHDYQERTLTIPPHAVYLWPGQTHFGPGVAGRAGEQAHALGATHAFLLADPGVVVLAQPVIDALTSAGLTYTLYTEVVPNPSVESVDAAALTFRRHGCDILIALGGGSAIDTAKGVRMLASRPGGSIFDYSYIRPNPLPTPFAHEMPPLIAIPTTAGTGAEVTPWGVITHTGSKRKFGIGGPSVTPTVALVDPQLTLGLPPALTAATGADALSHLIEAYVSTNEAPALDPMILHGITLLGRSLVRATQEGSDLAARTDVMLAAMLGGIAISTRWLGTCHSLAHPLSGVAGVPHGVANAIMLPHVVAFNRDAAQARYAQIALALEPALAEHPVEMQAGHAADAVRRLINAAEVLPPRLRDAGVNRDHLAPLATAAILDLNHTTNPRPCTEADLLALYEAAL